MNTNRPMGVVYDMPFADYWAVDAVSSTALRLMARSPWHYRNRVDGEPTRPMLRGSLAHCAALEPGALAARYIVTPEDAPKRPTPAQWAAAKSNESSMAAKAFWSAFEAERGLREVVTHDEYAVTQAQLAALQADPDIADILRTGRSEVSVFWIDAATGLYCKARPDHVHPVNARQVKLLDLKTCADESPNGFGRAAAALKYHIQRPHYIEGFQRASGLEVIEFVFAAVTNKPPVLAVPYVFTDEIAEQGARHHRELLDRFAECKRTDYWPAYGAGLQLLDLPAYAKDSTEVEVEWSE